MRHFPGKRLVGALFLWVRRLAGPLHRRKPALGSDEQDREERLPPLPAEWRGDDRWYRGDFPPRRHNRLTPLVHGETYFADLLKELATARERVTVAGWCLTPLMLLARGDDATASTVADALADASKRAEVYVLLWSGAPALFQPSTAETEEVQRVLLERAPGVHCELDRRAKFGHDHHQKAVTIDGRVAYIGGIDVSTFQGDRWDSDAHPLRHGPGWHDAQIRLEGEVVRDVEENFCQRWNAVTGASLAPVSGAGLDPAWQTPAQIVRTIPSGVYPFAPDGIHGIRHALLRGIASAERYIYLENQYIWDPEVVQALIEAMNKPRPDPFRIALLLPARALMGRYDNDEHVEALRKADGGRGIFEAYAPYAAGPAWGPTGYRYAAIYVHAKITIVDDRWLCMGSANLNGRGLATDTEMDVQAVAPDTARALRVSLWAEHLGMREDEVAAEDPLHLLEETWPHVAADMERCMKHIGPPPGGQIARYATDRNLRGRVLDVVQSLTLEK